MNSQNGIPGKLPQGLHLIAVVSLQSGVSWFFCYLCLLFYTLRWAVKEAAYKAMFPAYRPTWKELSYTSRNVSQKPSLKYDGNNHKDITLHVSVSHDGDYVVAQVLAEYDQTSR